jgi:Mn2+/Fe2+ NRAMP family transporter
MPTSTEQPARAEAKSMPDIFSSVRVSPSPQFWRQLLGFAGPGFLISVGYMDPGNWAADLAGGPHYGYTLLFVITASNLMAILLQSLSLKPGVASERDLAQACREPYSRPTSIALWLFAEVAIIACDLAAAPESSGPQYATQLRCLSAGDLTSDRSRMGPFVNRPWLKFLGYTVTVLIAGLNIWLLIQAFRGQ